MALFDWTGDSTDPTQDSKFASILKDVFSGNFSVTYGNEIESVIGLGEEEHIYGNYLTYTVDWEGFIQRMLQLGGSALGSALGGDMTSTLAKGIGRGLGATVFGQTGYANFVYGNNTGAIYGPSVNIQRGPITTITGKNWLFGGESPSTTPVGFSAQQAASAAELAKQSNIDNIVQAITTVLSLFMIGTGLATEVLASTVFKEPDLLDSISDEIKDVTSPTTNGKANPDYTDDPDTLLKDLEGVMNSPPPNAKLNLLLKSLSWGLTSRFMGWITTTEMIGQDLRDGVYKLPSIEDQLKAAKSDIESVDYLYNVADLSISRRITVAEQQIQQVKADAEGALDAAIDVLAGNIAAAQSAAVRAQQMASQTHLTVADWSVGAQGDIGLNSQDGNVTVYAGADPGCLLLDSKCVTSIRSGSASIRLMRGPVDVPNPQVLVSSGASGSVNLTSGVIEEGSAAALTPEMTTLRFGAKGIGATITLSEEIITLQVGAPGEGSVIEMTPTSIVLRVADTAMQLSPTGIREMVAEVLRATTADGHNLTAGETEFDIGVQGITSSSPVKTEEVDGASETNNSISNNSTEATKTNEITLNDFNS